MRPCVLVAVVLSGVLGLAVQVTAVACAQDFSWGWAYKGKGREELILLLISAMQDSHSADCSSTVLQQGKRHQQNMAKRAAREAAEKPAQPQPQKRAAIRKTVKIGRPGYRVTKQYDAEADQRSLLFQVKLAV